MKLQSTKVNNFVVSEVMEPFTINTDQGQKTLFEIKLNHPDFGAYISEFVDATKYVAPIVGTVHTVYLQAKSGKNSSGAIENYLSCHVIDLQTK